MATNILALVLRFFIWKVGFLRMLTTKTIIHLMTSGIMCVHVLMLRTCGTLESIETTHQDFKGVDLDKRRQKWRVRINVKGKDIWLGYFDNKVLAAWAYDLACLELHGDFAHINFPESLI